MKIKVLHGQSLYDIAIQYYLDAFNNSENVYFRAQMNFFLGQTYLTSGQADLAYERFQANLKGNAAADWLRVSPDGYGTLDVKITLETDDGAIVHATYNGRLQFDTMTVNAAPLFNTGDERYAWMNRIQAVSKGTFQPDGTLVYEMFELR
jgi:hypothetical protein